ncbi:vesicle-trafficking protein SEC22c isoform X1 [Fukomys damarensis]|uniref:vesicle-trafficking protein SEC22c isoform X1 n=1 Tax=Fukomys damarensis TaxID=885580 RepID=UPI00053F515F|nr:vesicle-trafficking protein SEC22c isoform X1 [Fukomys damarensis]XP_010622794.1 vesicle-trafficking protein SEC22c isoform X1 [Fukomys damarensis]XP_033618540.1 vesicle-trafficking protein SEC22c isoform X1 [Fukomys damarensis]
MSMIFFASVVRVRDGLPLSASTDFYYAPDFLECRRRLKALAVQLARHPGRGSAESRDFCIHFSSAGNVACMAICSRRCPAAMAFCFLETLWWEFTASFDNTRVGLASRPYAFLEFGRLRCSVLRCVPLPTSVCVAFLQRGVGTWQEAVWSRVSSWPEQHEAKHTGAGIGRDSALAMYSTIQKMKWHFNHGSASQMESSVAKVQEELGFQPPVVLSLEDADAAHSLANGHAPVHTEPAPRFRMEPVTTLGVLSLVLNIMCAALNLIRGVHLAERSLQVAQEEIGNILAFLVPFVACIFQCYLYLFYSPARTAKVLLMLLSICLGNVYLHGLRSLWQILFHVGVAFLSSHQTLTRQLQEKQSDCGV